MPTSPNSTPDLIDIVEDLAKRIKSLEKGVSSGGLPDPTSPILANLTVTGLTASTITRYVDPVTQSPRALVTWTWNDARTAANDDPAYDPPQKYQVSLTTPWVTTDRWVDVDSNSFTADNQVLNTNITLKVRAVSWGKRVGPTASNTTNTAKDIVAPIQPSTPTVTPELKGIRVLWDGRDVSAAVMAADTTYVEVHVSSTGATFTPSSATFVTRVGPTGCNIVLVMPNYVQYWVRLVAYDSSGNASVPSTAASATPQKALNTDMGIALPGDIAFRDEGNLVIDGSFESSLIRADRIANGAIVGSVTFDNTAGIAKHGSWAVKFNGDANPTKSIWLSSANGQAFEVPVGSYAGMKIYTAVSIRGISGTGTASMILRWTDAAGAQTTTTAATTTTSTGAYVLFESAITVPSTAVTMNVQLQTTSHNTGQWYFDSIQIRNIIGTQLIEDAAITNAKIGLLAVNDANIASANVGKLTAGSIAAGQQIIAGDATSSNAQMTDTGFYVYAADPIDGVPNLSVRMGTTDNDLFAVCDVNGDPVASFSDTGVGVMSDLMVDNGQSTARPMVNGYPLIGSQGGNNFEVFDYLNDAATTGRDLETDPLGHMETYAKGNATWMQFNAASFGYTAVAGQYYYIFDISFDLEPGRQYAVTVPPLMCQNGTSGGTVGLILFYTTDGSRPDPATSAVLARNYVSVPTSGFCSPQIAGRLINGGSTVQSQVRIIALLYSINTSVKMFEGTTPYITDLGPTKNPGGRIINALGPGGGAGGTIPTDTAPKAYTKTYSSNGWATYRGTGTPLRGSSAGVGDTGYHIFQGYSSPGSFNGDQKGLWTFPSITADVGTGTITKVEAYIYFVHWYNNSGGTAFIRVHGYSSGTWPTAGLPTLVPCVTSAGWPKPGGRWVTLPSSFYAAFKSGTYKGIGIGAAGSTSTTYYGYASTAPKLRVTYVK